MSIKNKIKNFVKKKNLNPMNNRKKVGIILFATSIGLFFLFAFRLTYIVAVGKVSGVSLAAKTEALYQGSSVVKAKRGAILDRNGETIAEDATSYSVYAILSETYLGEDKKKLYAQPKDFDTIADVLSKHTKLSKEEALAFLKNGIDDENKPTQYQVEFGGKGKGITIDERQKIEDELKEKKITGVYFEGHPARAYPNGEFASHFIGYVDQAKDESKGLVGKMGLEQAYNDLLSGTDGKVEYQKDVYGNPLPGTIASEKKAVDGEDIYTTLDLKIQSRLEELMDPVMEEYKPQNMTAILMKAKTGEILAMSQRPSFNPETKDDLGDEDNGGAAWRNILVEDQFEPGSTMKLFTTAAAIQEGKFNPDATFVYPAGGYKLDDRSVKDHDEGKKGLLTFRQALSWSSNVGMLNLEQSITGEVWKSYLEKFGFGKSTNSGLIGEVSGKLPGDNWVDQAMSSFGQAVSVTNFQMMQAFTAIANDGSMIKPQFIKKIENHETGESKETQTEKVGDPVVSAQAVSDIRTYMIDTVEDPNYGIAYDIYKVEGYHVAAKTGTAQFTEDGGYVEGKTNNIYSVVEMVPADNPEYILYLTAKRPEAQSYNQQMLAKIANPLMKFVMDTQNNDENK